MKTTRRLLRPLLTAVAAFLMITTIGVTAASADPYPTAEVQVGANIRQCASTSCYSYGTVGHDSIWKSTQTSWVACYTDGDWATGNYRSNRWFKVYVTASGSSYAFWGFVHSSYVYNQPRVTRC